MEQLTLEGFKWVIILCMLLTLFPEAIAALTDLIFISEKRLSYFLLVLAQS